MREILFRGKRIDNGQWVYGDLCHRKMCGAVLPTIRNKVYGWVDPATVGQYTGLTDKNGTKIFEGDIATLISRNPLNYGMTVNAKFLFVNGSFMAYLLDRECLLPEIPIRDISKDTEITIIGNIHDSPKLVKILTQHNK